MRWMWVDKIVEIEPNRRIAAVKNVSLAEDVLSDHFPAEVDPDTGAKRPAEPVMPASLIIEGMAQAAGMLVGHVQDFKEKVILAKISRASLDYDVSPGQTIRFEAEIDRADPSGVSTVGTVRVFDHVKQRFTSIGEIDLVFSHIDRNRSGLEFPEENFVFTDLFTIVLRDAGMVD